MVEVLGGIVTRPLGWPFSFELHISFLSCEITTSSQSKMRDLEKAAGGMTSNAVGVVCWRLSGSDSSVKEAS